MDTMPIRTPHEALKRNFPPTAPWGSRAEIRPGSRGIAPKPEERLSGPPAGTPMRASGEPSARRPHGGCRVRMHFSRGLAPLGSRYHGFYRAAGEKQPGTPPEDPREATNATLHPRLARDVENIVKTSTSQNSHTGSPVFYGVTENRSGKGTVKHCTLRPRGSVSSSKYGVSRFPNAKIAISSRRNPEKCTFRHAKTRTSLQLRM